MIQSTMGLHVLGKLLFMTLLLQSTARRYEFRPSCCVRVLSKPISLRSIKTVTIQKAGALCPIDAVIVRTTRNKVVCLDPKVLWANPIIKLHASKSMKEQMYTQ